MTAVKTLAGAASNRKVNWPQIGIVKLMLKNISGFCKEPFGVLERHKVKALRAVLRGLGGGNAARLPSAWQATAEPTRMVF